MNHSVFFACYGFFCRTCFLPISGAHWYTGAKMVDSLCGGVFYQEMLLVDADKTWNQGFYRTGSLSKTFCGDLWNLGMKLEFVWLSKLHSYVIFMLWMSSIMSYSATGWHRVMELVISCSLFIWFFTSWVMSLLKPLFSFTTTLL